MVSTANAGGWREQLLVADVEHDVVGAREVRAYARGALRVGRRETSLAYRFGTRSDSRPLQILCERPPGFARR